jgi:DMSO/TMAO reductase YedYZ molybdopterin-dependent catalytic subunit
MGKHTISRRDAMLAGGGLVAGLAFLRLERLVAAAPLEQGEVVITWLDQPASVPPPAQGIIGQQLQWEELDSWITPTDKFFTVKHFGQPTVDTQKWRLDVTGLVKQPLSLTIDQLKARPRQEVTFTLECSGNTGLPFFWGGVGNATWAGAALAPLLQEAGVLDGGKEIVFYAHDIGKQKVRDMDLTTPFARSMSVSDAMNPDNLLCYEMNGQPLEAGHGAPLRLLTPGWYGVANVKWLHRIEVIDTRFAGHFMARDYVTIREEQRDGQPLWTFSTVRHDRLKSAPARVVRRGSGYVVLGVAWGAAIAAVEVSIDKGPWLPARLFGPVAHNRNRRGLAWRFWTFGWEMPATGQHMVTSRAFDADGNVQPAPDDPFLASKVTFWESNGHITRQVLIP